MTLVIVKIHFGLRELHGDDVKGLFARFDVDGNGGIDSAEFASYLTDSFPESNLAEGGVPARKQKAITDLPTTYNTGANMFKTTKRLKHELKEEFRDLLQRQGDKVVKAFHSTCIQSGASGANIADIKYVF